MSAVPSVPAGAIQSGKDAVSQQSKKDVIEKGSKAFTKAGPTLKEASAKKEYKVPYINQCGLENDGTVWSPNKGPKRITSSLATPEEQAKYQTIIDTCLSYDTVFGKRVDFDPNDVMKVMIEVKRYFVTEPVLIEDVPAGITIVGDLHGQLYDLVRIFEFCAKEGKPGYLCTKYLFMGDYVDRGQQSLEILMLLFCLKMLYPNNFFLLRGNHEFARQNYKYGFADEIGDRYCDATAPLIFSKCNEAFCFMSLAAIVDDKYFCVHGGISPRFFTRFTLRGLRKPIIHSTDDVLIQDMMWSDPAVGLRGSAFNYERGSSVHFGLDTLVRALYNVDCIALFRGHFRIKEGFDNQWDICFTVFSATSKDNDASIALINDKGKVQVVILLKSEKQLALNEVLFGSEAPDATTVDDQNANLEVQSFEEGQAPGQQ